MPTDAQSSEEKIEDQLLVDIYIDQDGSPLAKHPAFGVFGAPLGDDVCPFVIRTDGVVDYGFYAASAEAERYGRCPVHQRKMAVGELVPYEDNSFGSWTLRIVAVER